MTERHGTGRSAGFTLIEMAVAFAAFAVVAMVAIPHMPNRDYGLWNAHSQMVADLRQARADAITKGDHFRVTFVDETNYEIRRLRDDDRDGEWTPDEEPLHTRTLPAHVTLAEGSGEQVEFNTRGLMVLPHAVAPLKLSDDRTYQDRWITIWPSGQVAPTQITDLEAPPPEPEV